jgi:membrane protein DedA with SNARE-associated domain
MKVTLGAALFTFFYKLLYKVGPLFLFLSLVLGIVGFPIPDEIMLIGAGYLIFHQKLNVYSTLISAILGSILGITISYLIGRLIGRWVVKKYGETLNITPEKINLAKFWFSRLGKWTLVLGYFIPIFRHLVGFVAGFTKLNYKDFALFAYTGAIIWTLFFLGLGYFFNKWFVELFGK